MGRGVFLFERGILKVYSKKGKGGWEREENVSISLPLSFFGNIRF
jgi:hypothetical protein